jgi:hypothetical protein
VSRIGTRLARLERQLGGCPECAERPVAISVHGPASPPSTRPPECCPSCGEPVEQIRLLLSFDPLAEDTTR